MGSIDVQFLGVRSGRIDSDERMIEQDEVATNVKESYNS